MITLSSYVLDRDAIKLDAYRLLCLFYANKEISRLSDPTHEYPDASVLLERRFFPRELTRLLLSIAVALRTLDDQMEQLDSANAIRTRYMQARDRTNKNYDCMMFDDMPLREVCNKIIHAYVVEPHHQDGEESHQYDIYAWEAWQAARDEGEEVSPDQPESLSWQHMTGNVRLGGMRSRKQWWHLLMVPVFVEAIYDLLNDNDCGRFSF
ncbi:hypothetical protein [Denitromonas sp.]|uniref:hypothetical protein n=1 Tax=Denitromonas sp. TaxID=2734609 RepID=UPI003A898780